ncbi:hypothetical protein AAG906_038372 [Vitis piasezkii]
MGGKGNEQDLTDCFKENTGANQRKVGGGTARRLVGLPDHARVTHRKHFFCYCIWHGRNHPHGNRFDENKELERNLDWADEVRENTSIRMAAYQQRVAAHYNRKARPRVFKVGTLVIRRVFENTAKKGPGSSKRIGKALTLSPKQRESGAYHLQKLDGIPLLRPWNVSNLKQYYQ